MSSAAVVIRSLRVKNILANRKGSDQPVQKAKSGLGLAVHIENQGSFHSVHHMGHMKQKCAFKHVQNVWIYIILHLCKGSSGHII